MRTGAKQLVAPRLLPLHLLGVVLTTAAVLLGLWQLQNWQAQRAAEAQDLTRLAPVPLEQALSSDEAFPAAAVGRPVRTAGVWIPEATFYVSGRDLGERSGFWAVTPAAVCGDPAACEGAPALLVVRGWTPDPAEAPAPPEGEVAMVGWLQPPEGSGQPDPDPTDDVLPELRIADAIQRVDQDLYSAYLIAEDTDPAQVAAGLEPVTPDVLPPPDSSAGLRNLLYAVEWWVFAAFAAFVWWRWARDELARADRARTADVPSEP